MSYLAFSDEVRMALLRFLDPVEQAFAARACQDMHELLVNDEEVNDEWDDYFWHHAFAWNLVGPEGLIPQPPRR